jgi:hypothetical protein
MLNGNGLLTVLLTARNLRSCRDKEREMAQQTEFYSYGTLWREAKRWGIAGTSGSTATTCTLHARELATALAAACGFTITFSGSAAQHPQSTLFQANPTVA